MSTIRNFFVGGVLLTLVLQVAVGSPASAASIEEDLAKRIENVSAAHPRLFFTADEAPQLKAKIESDPLLKAVYRYLEGSADAQLDEFPVKREKVGRRLLGVCAAFQITVDRFEQWIGFDFGLQLRSLVR
ncbi:MAG: hypothetical protein R6V12_10785, partial [Candidatus Hydrogenedentota bacterium]